MRRRSVDGDAFIAPKEDGPGGWGRRGRNAGKRRRRKGQRRQAQGEVRRKEGGGEEPKVQQERVVKRGRERERERERGSSETGLSSRPRPLPSRVHARMIISRISRAQCSGRTGGPTPRSRSERRPSPSIRHLPWQNMFCSPGRRPRGLLRGLTGVRGAQAVEEGLGHPWTPMDG